MTNEAILYEQAGNIVTITYNRPDQQNAINGQMRKELNAAWDKFNEDKCQNRHKFVVLALRLVPRRHCRRACREGATRGSRPSRHDTAAAL